MSPEIYILCVFLVSIPQIHGDLYTQDWDVHGSWFAQGRGIQKITHFSCTLPVPMPIDNFAITIESLNSIVSVTTWSLELVSKDSEDRVFTFQNKRRVYPPRVVLNFHIYMLGAFDASGNCSFNLLTERLTTSAPDVTTGILHPWLRPIDRMDDFLLPGTANTDSTTFSEVTTFSSTSSSDPFADTIPDPCVQKWEIFPDSTYALQKLPELGPPPGVATPAGPGPLPPIDNFGPGNRLPPPPSNRLPLPPPRKKRAIWDQGSEPPQIFPSNFLDKSVTLNYPDAIEKSMMFYTAQRSGNFDLPKQSSPNDWVRSSGEYHTTADGKDLSGGWYNGNDNLKLTFPMAAATSVLAWGYTVWKDTYQYGGFKLDNKFKEMIKWPLDYFLKSWDLKTETLYVQIGNVNKERTIWERADAVTYRQLWDNNAWPVYSVTPLKPGSDVAAEVATAMALSSLIEFESSPESLPTTTGAPDNGFWLGPGGRGPPIRSPRIKRKSTVNAEYNTRLLDTAEQIYRFAKTYPGKYSDVVPVAGNEYPDYTSSGYVDELCFAASVLHSVTGKQIYLSEAKSHFKTFANAEDPKYFSWDDKRTACAVMLYKITRQEKYANYLNNFREYWMGASGQTTPDGFAWRSENGTFGVTSNAIFILLQSIEAGVFEPDVAIDIYSWSTNQINYMLGTNGMHYSYLIGYGDDFVKNPYHKNSACSQSQPCGSSFYNSDTENVNVLVGALVGGPEISDYHSDSRQNKLGNSVALDYNAGFQSALAGLQKKKLELGKLCTENMNGKEPTTPQVHEHVTTPTTEYTTIEQTPVPSKPTTFDYADALRKSMLFYAAQRSGTEPERNPIPWRRWDMVDTGNIGGWYDDGSAVKTTKVMASAVITIGWGAIKFKAGYEAAGALPNLYDCLRWPLEYFIKIWSRDTQTLVQRVGQEAYERGTWSRPVDRKTYFFRQSISLQNQAGGADVASDVATALVIGAEIFKENDTSFSERLMMTAKEVYKFAKQFERMYIDSDSTYYSIPGDTFADEMCVAAWWMYRVTKDTSYYDDGMTYSNKIGVNSLLEWKTKNHLCHLLRAVYVEDGNTDTLQKGLDYWIKQVQRTPQGLAWAQIEPLKFAANGAFLHVITKEEVGLDEQSSDFYKTQIDYMLGNNEQAFSYQIGYGQRYPRRPHHRASSCPDYMDVCDWSIYNGPGKNPHELTGALVSGPDINDVYEDVRSNYTTNRVSVEHNAGFQSVLAYLVMKQSTTTTPSSVKSPTTSTRSTPETTKKPDSTESQLSPKPSTPFVPPNVNGLGSGDDISASPVLSASLCLALLLTVFQLSLHM